MGESSENQVLDRRKEALEEYYCIEKMINNYDDQVFKIKSWSITVSTLAIGAGIKENLSALFLLASGSSLIFWLIEAKWKYYQYIAVYRGREIEESLNSNASYTGPRINRTFSEQLKKTPQRKARSRRIFWLPNVRAPYHIVFSLGVSAWLYYNVHWLIR